MSWRTGAELFAEMWPLIQAKVKPGAMRKDFVRDILAVFLDWDVDPFDIEDLHPEVARALQYLAKDSGENDNA